jgi:hypothetical protein
MMEPVAGPANAVRGVGLSDRIAYEQALECYRVELRFYVVINWNYWNNSIDEELSGRASLIIMVLVTITFEEAALYCLSRLYILDINDFAFWIMDFLKLRENPSKCINHSMY